MSASITALDVDFVHKETLLGRIEDVDMAITANRINLRSGQCAFYPMKLRLRAIVACNLSIKSTISFFHAYKAYLLSLSMPFY